MHIDHVIFLALSNIAYTKFSAVPSGEVGLKLRAHGAHCAIYALLLYGYSGCGKTTVLTQFSEKYPEFIHFIPDFTSLSPAQMLAKMGNCIFPRRLPRKK